MEKDPGGAPTKYQEDYARMAQVACEEAPFTDLKLSKLFNVAKSTINEWKKEYPDFKKALKDGKDTFDTTKVEKAFFKRCTGYKFTETTREPGIFRPQDGKPMVIENPEMVVTRKVTRHVVPDAKGCMDWLCNRMPSRWKKLKHVEITGKDGGPVKTETGMVAVPSGPMTIEEWEKEVKEARKHDTDVEPGQIPGNA